MLNCLYKNKRICSLDLKDEYSNYNISLKLEWREASQCNELTCEDCGGTIILRAGYEKEPHFAHKNLAECYYENSENKESEEHRAGKRILYHYFKRQYPDANVQINFRHYNKRQSDIFIDFNNDRRLAVGYQRQNLKIREFKEKHQSYQDELGIRDIWILSTIQFGKEKGKRRDEKQKIEFFEELLLYYKPHNNTLIFLNSENQKITLVRKLEYNSENKKYSCKSLFSKSFNLYDIRILSDGTIESTFGMEYQQKQHKFQNYCKDIEQEAIKNEMAIEELNKQKEAKRLALVQEYLNINKKKEQNRNSATTVKQGIATCEDHDSVSMPDQSADRHQPVLEANWLICKRCGKRTNKYWFAHKASGTCICYDC